MNSSCSVWKSIARPASSPFGLHSDRSLFSGWVQPMSAEQTGQAWTVKQSMRSISPLSTYLSSHLNKTTLPKPQSHYPDTLASAVQSSSSGADTVTFRHAHLKLKRWHPRRVPSSISVTAEQRGRGADVYSCAAAAASCSQSKRRNDSDVKKRDAARTISRSLNIFHLNVLPLT